MNTKFIQIVTTLCIVPSVVFPTGVYAQPSGELVLSKVSSVSDGWQQYIVATVTNESPFLYKNAEVDVKFTHGLTAGSSTLRQVIISTKNLKSGSVWHIKYAVPTSVFHGNEDRGFTITRVLGVRGGSVRVSSRISTDDVPYPFTNPIFLHGSMTSRTDLFNAVEGYPITNSLSDIKAAIKAGADVNAQNNKGNTSLIIAVLEDKPEIVTVLLEDKADPNLENFEGSTAIDYAVLDLPGEKKTQLISALQKVGSLKGSGNKAMLSDDHNLLARVQSFEPSSDNADVYILEGILTNISSRKFSHIEIDANFKNVTEIIDSGSANIQNLGPHETSHFSISTAKHTDDYKLTKIVNH